MNPDHPKGKNKAQVFVRVLGIGQRNAEELRKKLFEAAVTEEAIVGELDIYGQRYTIDFEMRTEVGNASIRSGWIVLHAEQFPRLTTCFVVKKK